MIWIKTRDNSVERLIKYIRHPKNFCPTSLTSCCDYYQLLVDGCELSMCQRVQQIEIHYSGGEHVATVAEFASAAVHTWVNTAAVLQLLNKIAEEWANGIQ